MTKRFLLFLGIQFLLATANFASDPTFVFVGKYYVGDGPCWNPAPPCYTAREAAALVFGGLPGDYAISVSPNTTDPATITHTAWVDGFGDTRYLITPAAEDFKIGLFYLSDAFNPPVFSAFVHDHSDGPTHPCYPLAYSYINYVWRRDPPSGIDTHPPILTTDAHDIYLKDAPITFAVSATGICGDPTIELAVTCQAVTQDGKIIDKSGSCSAQISGNAVTISDAGRVGNIITIFAIATDACGNQAQANYIVHVLRPDHEPANEGVGNGVDGNTPGHLHNGGNDDSAFTPGNPGAKSKQ